MRGIKKVNKGGNTQYGPWLSCLIGLGSLPFWLSHSFSTCYVRLIVTVTDDLGCYTLTLQVSLDPNTTLRRSYWMWVWLQYVLLLQGYNPDKFFFFFDWTILTRFFLVCFVIETNTSTPKKYKKKSFNTKHTNPNKLNVNS